MKQIVYEFKPLVLGKYLRFDEGRWTPSDGSEWDLSFVGISDSCMAWYFNIEHRENILWSWVKNGEWRAQDFNHPRGNAWHYQLKKGEQEWGDIVHDNTHPNYIAYRSAMDKCCLLYRCANGRGPEFHINDSYILKGLLREKETKKIVRFPRIFDCMYCGKHNWKKEESE